ncbi:unnamed protein product, partial [Prunus brigantina]
VGCANLSAWFSGPRGRAFNTESYFWMRCGLCAGVPARSTVRREGKMLDKTRPFPPINRCHGREEVPSGDRVLLGTNIAPTSLDSSVAAWPEAEWIPRDGPFAFFLLK